jgi:hypothetical protein
MFAQFYRALLRLFSLSSTAVRPAQNDRKPVTKAAAGRTAAKKSIGLATKGAVRRTMRSKPAVSKMELSEAIDILAENAGQFDAAGRYQRPSVAQVEKAWAAINSEPLVAYLKALIKLRRPLPVFDPKKEGDEILGANTGISRVTQKKIRWIYRIHALPVREVGIIIKAIWDDAELKAFTDVNEVLARDIEHLLRGFEPHVMYLNGPPAKREMHVRAPMTEAHPLGRPIILQIYEYGPGGPLEILDRGGGTLSRITIDLSRWQLLEGWLVADGRRKRDGGQNGEAGAPPAEVNEPPTPKAGK